MSEWAAVANRAGLDAQGRLLVWLGEDWPVALFDVDGSLYAVDARCTHEDELLARGVVDPRACEVICPLHQARFDLRTGQATRGPAAAPLTTYPVRQDANGTVWVKRVRPWWASP